jgi:hypothetical protein
MRSGRTGGGAVERHEASSGLLYTWRHPAMSWALGGTTKRAHPSFAEGEIHEPAIVPPPRAVAVIGQIGIELPVIWRGDPAPVTSRTFLACGATDMRKESDGLAVLVDQALEQSPHGGALFAFRGKRGDLAKLLW